jgi:hypothetical protein
MDIETTEIDLAAATAWGRVAISDELDIDQLAYIEFCARVLAERFTHVLARRWTTSASSLDPVLPHASMTSRWYRRRTALLDLGPVLGSDCLAYVSLGDETASVRVAARELPVVAEAEGWLRAELPERKPTAAHNVAIRFWSQGVSGGHSVSRTIEVPTWSEIRANYPAAVQTPLDVLLSADWARHGGQLVLWHGDPGTGKTYALRALAWEWRSWCDLHYVTDPESFFGGRTDYLLDVILPDEERESKRWRLVVLEDTGELLAADARAQTGQGLSRLLNVVDGIIGQGLRVLVLVTTNEPLKRLHPAISRPGRCAAKVEFAGFPADEAARWLAERGASSAAAREGGTLADLFARSEGREEEARRPIGFTLESPVD